MAKDVKDGKIQFVFVNVEGDQATLQEALRQVGTVLNRGINPPPKMLVAVPTGKSLPVTNGDNGSSNETYELKDEVVDRGPDQETLNSLPEKVKKPKRIPKTPPLLKDFNPHSAEVSLSDFASQKDVSTIFNKYLVIAAWFKKYQGVDEISTSHIYTCFGLMDWKCPDDMPSQFRKMKNLHRHFDNGSKNRLWAISIIGLNAVDKMMAKTAE